MRLEEFVSSWAKVYIIENAASWTKMHWLNADRDISSSTYGPATFCTKTSCRLNKFNLSSKVNQQFWVGVATNDARDYEHCGQLPEIRHYV
jgi:hypothetical protein